jgi:hypothetical protein
MGNMNRIEAIIDSESNETQQPLIFPSGLLVEN